MNIQWYETREGPNDKEEIGDNFEAFSRIAVVDNQIYFPTEAFGLSLAELIACVSFHQINAVYTFVVDDNRGLSGGFVGAKTIRGILVREHPEQVNDFDQTIKELEEDVRVSDEKRRNSNEYR